MDIRKATVDDLEVIMELFQDTIQHVNAKDYTPEQIEVWQSAKDRNIWLKKLKEQSFFVCIIENQVVGFSSIDTEGYLDFMYTHKDHQRKGVAKALLDTIEKQAKSLNLDRIWTSSSITAQPFFAKYGYKHYEDEHKMLSGVHFKNALMEKTLK